MWYRLSILLPQPRKLMKLTPVEVGGLNFLPEEMEIAIAIVSQNELSQKVADSTLWLCD